MYAAAKVDLEKCIVCKLCIFTCPDPNVIMLDENKKITVDESRCKACGLCAKVCPKDAITVRES